MSSTADSGVWKAVGAWWMATVLLLFYILSLTDRLIVSMLIAPIQAELGLSDLQMSLLVGPAFAIIYAIGGLPSGWAADHWHRRWVIFCGVILWSLASAMSGLAQGFAVLFALRLLVGVGEAALTPAAYSLIADKFPRKRLATALAFYTMGAKLGTAFAFAAGGWAFAVAAKGIELPFIGQLSSWRATWLMIAAPGLLLAFLVFTFTEPPRAKRAKSKGPPFAELFAYIRRNGRLFGLIMTGFAMVGTVSGALAGWVPTYLTRQFGWTPVEYGPVMGVVSLAVSLSLMPKGLIVDWLHGKGMPDIYLRFFTWLLGVTILVLSAAFMMRTPTPFLVFYAIANMAALSVTLFASAIIQSVAPSHLRGQLTALYLATINVFTGLGPVAVAAVTDLVFRDKNRLGESLAYTGVSLLIGAFVLLRLALRQWRRSDPTESAPAA